MPLTGIKVLDVASYVACPAAATVMADFGADVIKIEPPTGDAYRGLAARYRTDYNWLLTSRNKKGLALDLNHDAGREVLSRLIREADVLLLNFRDAQLDRYQLRWEQVRELNPRIVYAHLTGYGSQGPDKDRRAYDSAAWWARSGIVDLMKPHKGAPTMPVGGVGDHASAMSLFGAIMMALYHREKTGEGGCVSTSLAANGAWSNGMHLQGMIAGYNLGEILEEKGYRSPFAMIYQTADQRYLLLIMPDPWKEWGRLCQTLNKEEWHRDPRFADIQTLMNHRDELKLLLQQRFAELSLNEVDVALKQADITYSLIHRIEEVIEDPQLLENDIVVQTGSGNPDYQKTVANPIQFAGFEKRKPSLAPAIGEHSRSVLEAAGYSKEDIDSLIAAEVVVCPS